MGLFDELKKLTRPYSGDEYDDFSDEYTDAPEETRVPPAESSRRQQAAERRNPFADAESSPLSYKREKVVSLNSPAQPQVVLVKPERFEAAAEIADHLRGRRSVVMNLEDTAKDTARRLIDFLSGVAYALDGQIKKVASSTYIITPHNVDLVGDLIDGMDTSGLYL